MGLWIWLYDKPERSKHVNQAELDYINQDEANEAANNIETNAEANATATAKEEKTIGFLKCFTFRQTWSFIVGKFMTDGVWWFFLSGPRHISPTSMDTLPTLQWVLHSSSRFMPSSQY